MSAGESPMSFAMSGNTEVLDTARRLVGEMEAGHEEEVARLLGHLTQLRESLLFQEVGRLTRQLHDALANLSLEDDINEITSEKVPEAKERLNYVITMTEQSANRTLEAVERSLPLSDHLSQRSDLLAAEWQRFRQRELQPAQFRSLSKEIEVFLGEVASQSGQIRSDLSEVLMAQDFQDLTGQVIQKVIALVQEVEEKLVQLIRITSEVDKAPPGKDAPASRGTAAEGPQMTSQQGPETVSGQDEVDDLLSSLGF